MTNLTEGGKLHRDDTLLFQTSDTYQSGNLTQAEGFLHVLVMANKYPDPGTFIGESDTTTVLCRIVNKTAAGEADNLKDEGKDGGTNEGKDEDEPGSAAGGWRYSMGAVLGTFVFSALFIGL